MAGSSSHRASKSYMEKHGVPGFGFVASYMLCLNGKEVPVETKNMILLDPLNLAEKHSLNLPDSTDLTEVNLVSFMASGDQNWLCKSLQLPGGHEDKHGKSRWWAYNSHRVPLILEIKQAIKALKQKKKANQPTDHHCLILLEIRGKLLWVKNSSTAVILGLTKEPGTLNVPQPDIDPLVWFCTQLQKDIDEDLQDKPDKRAHTEGLDEHEEQVEEVLEQLKAHPQCQVAHFVPSRTLFKIHKKSGKTQGAGKGSQVSEVKVLGLNKWRKKQGASQGSQDPFQKCLSMGLSFLDETDDAPDGPDDTDDAPETGPGEHQGLSRP